jgi:uncharacterized protein (DUF1330 family)
MPAYVIVEITVTDPQVYEEYRKLTPGSLVPFEGRFAVRGGYTETLEGEWKPERIVVLEFPTLEKAKAWYHSDVYTAAKHIRLRSANTKMIVVEGV